MENKKQSGEGASVAHAIKTRAKKYPRLYVALHRIFAPSFGLLGAPSLRSLAEGIFKKNAEAKIANIGSGVERVHPRVVNVDIFPLSGVDIVARAESLPFKDASLDGIFLSEVLEHILDTAEAVREIRRALQSGGLVYIRVPFLYPFHESPGDFYRWTLSGLRYLFTGFEEIKSGAAGGPFALLQAALMHIMGLLDKQTHGTVSLLGRDVSHLSEESAPQLPNK